MKIKVSKELTKWFIKEAKKKFPAEYYGYLAGTINGDEVRVELLIPPLLGSDEIVSDQFSVRPSQLYWERAATEAKNRGLVVVGDIHSHCYDDIGDNRSDPAPSFMDFVRFEGKKNKNFVSFAICEIREIKGRKYSKVTFWEAKAPPKISYAD